MKTLLLQFTWYWQWGLGYWVVFFLQQISYSSSDKTICRLTPSGFLLGCVAAVTTIRLKYCQRTGPAIQESRTPSFSRCCHLSLWAPGWMVPGARGTLFVQSRVWEMSKQLLCVHQGSLGPWCSAVGVWTHRKVLSVSNSPPSSPLPGQWVRSNQLT